LRYRVWQAVWWLTWRSPRAYALVARVRGRREYFRRDFDLAVDGYPRSGNSYARAMLEVTQPPELRLRAHGHNPCFVYRMLELKVPVLFIIRRPEDAVTSWAHYKRWPVERALAHYVVMHRLLATVRERLVTVPFELLTTDFRAVISRFNARTGLRLREDFDEEAAVAEAWRRLDEKTLVKYGQDPVGRHYRPPVTPDPARQAARETLRSRSCRLGMRQADLLYRGFMETALEGAGGNRRS